MRVRLLMWCSPLLLMGCLDRAPGMEPGHCTDADGDGYGLGAGCAGADCDDADPSCFAGSCCLSPCEDGLDNDGDGLIDQADPDCDTGETPVEPECAPDGTTPGPDRPCCEGLIEVPLVYIEDGRCQGSTVNLTQCVSTCGDGVCDLPAEPCNCPQDCTEAPPVVEHCSEIGEATDLDHPCCEGLTAVPLVMIENGFCQATAALVCTDTCGDGLCDLPVEPCSCPQDC